MTRGAAARRLHHWLAVAVAGTLVAGACRSRPPGEAAVPDNAIHHNNLGVALMDAAAGDPTYIKEAVKEFEHALEAAPPYVRARANLGTALYYAGQSARATEVLRAVVAEHPAVLQAHYVLGLLHEIDGRFDEAASAFRIVTEGDREDPDAWYHLGYAVGRAGRPADAVAPLRRAAELQPYQRRARYALFTALNRAGQTAEAEVELNRFRAIDASQVRVVDAPKSPLEYLKQGKYGEATADSRAPAQAGAPPPARFTDVTAESGLSWPADLAGGGPGACAAFIDANNDGRLDVFVARGPARRLYEQGADGLFADVTASRGLETTGSQVAACAWADYDNNGWPDVAVVGPGGLELYRGEQRRFKAVAAIAAVARAAGPAAPWSGVAWGDVDHDGDVDLVVTAFSAARPGSRAPGHLLVRNNGDGTFTEIGDAAGLRAVGPARGVWFSDVNEDRAVDLVLGTLDGAPTALLNRKDGTFVPSAGSTPPAPPVQVPPGSAIARGDYDADGAVDELVVRPGAPPMLRRNDVRPSRWLTVRLAGYAVAGKVKSNRLGVGTTIEVRTPGFWQRRELRAGNGAGGSDALEVTFELGAAERLDFVRAVFPSGVRKTLRDVDVNRVVTIEEPLLDVNSCPTVFAWNGQRFEFITDTLGAGILGELVAPGRYSVPDPDEWVRIEGRQLQPDAAGRLELRFTNPLEEVTYLDRVRLVAVDHAAGMEVFTDERMPGQSDPDRQVRLYGVTGARPLAAAWDGDGREVTTTLARMDRQYFDRWPGAPFKGFAGDWSLALDLGPDLPSAPVLLIDGWSYWNSSASVVAAAQAGQALEGPTLEVRDVSGRWRTGLADLGVHAGLPRSMLVDLVSLLRPGEREIRIRSNRTLYYDRIRVAQAVGSTVLDGATAGAPGTTAELPLRASTLGWAGYPARVLPDGRLPEVFDYGRLQPDAEWGTHAGLLTRYGDVAPLLARRDDRFVVMEHGEEVRLSFDGSALPALGPGRRRTFFFYSDGYEKGYELHSGQSATVDALPFHAMRSYPHDGGGQPADVGYLNYLFEWNTRPSWRRW